MSALFKQPDQSVTPSAAPGTTDFTARLLNTGTAASENIDDRRPIRPGSLPGAIGIPTPPAERGLVDRQPPPPEQSGQLSSDAGVNNITAKGDVRDFSMATQRAAVERRVQQRTIKDIQDAADDEAIRQSTHQPTLEELIAAERRKRGFGR
jgi:hypothetical protein